MAQLSLCFYITAMAISQLDPVLNPIGYIISSAQPILNAMISQEGMLIKCINYCKRKLNLHFGEKRLQDGNHIRIWIESATKAV